MIYPEHLKEWLNSAVDPQLIELNIESFSGSQPYEALLYSDQIERRNSGRLSDYWLKKYRHIENGGWWCAGSDVLTGDRSLWGCFKPNTPRAETFKGFDHSRKSKTIKYEHPPKVPTEIFALRVPLHIWQKIAERYGLTVPSLNPDDFWQWVIENPEVPIIITEGAKKAGALLTAGYAAIGLPGINGGFRIPKDEEGYRIGNPRLIPQLQVFAKEGREFYLCYDQDTKQRTRRDVNRCIDKTAKLLVKEGCQIKVISWNPKLGKGVDDVIAVNGSDSFNNLYDSADTFEYWLVKQSQQLTYSIDLKINSRYLGSFAPPANAKLIGIKSPKGSGKTHSISEIIAPHLNNGGKILVLTHRVQLGEELCKRFGVEYVTELKYKHSGFFGYGLCVDSLHPLGQAQFIAADWEDAWIIIDEAEQVFWHLLNSSTCQSERVLILRCLKRVIELALSTDGKVFLSDADLSDTAIDYVKSLAGFDLKPWIVVNNWKPDDSERWLVNRFSGSNPSGIIASLEKCIQEGEKPFICLSGQKKKSQWGTQNLESYLRRKFPDKKILRIDRESIADPEHPAYGCITHLDEILPEYDIVIASPTIETGVSIECHHFTSVWGIFQGVQTADSCRQALSRVRDNVPRYVWARKTGFNRIADGSTSIKSILFSQHKLAQANINQLRKADFTDEIDTDFQPESLITWAKKAAAVNLGMKHYRDSIFQGLEEEGHIIIDIESDEAKAEIVKTEVKENKESEYQAHCEAVTNVESPDSQQFKFLQDKRTKTETERLQFEKGNLENLYHIPVTPKLVEKHDAGWHSNIRLHYYLTVGATYLPAREANIMQKMLLIGEGSIFKPDANRSLLGTKIAVLKWLGFERLLEKREFSSLDPVAQEIAQKCKDISFEIKVTLGLTVSKKDSVMAIIQRLVGLIGYRFPRLQQERHGDERVRIYGSAAADFQRDTEGKIIKDSSGQAIPVADGRDDVFAAWLARDSSPVAAESSTSTVAPQEAVEGVSTLGTGVINIDLSSIGGVTEGGVPDEPEPTEFELSQLIEALALVETQEQFKSAISGHSLENIEDAILFQTQKMRKQLEKWLVVEEQSQLPNTNLDFCLSTLVVLESHDHPSINSSEQVIALFSEMETRGARCNDELPKDFWERVAFAVGSLFEKLESQNQVNTSISEPDPVDIPDTKKKTGILQTVVNLLNFKVGDWVTWLGAPDWFKREQINRIEDNYAWVNYWASPIPVDKLILCE